MDKEYDPETGKDIYGFTEEETRPEEAVRALLEQFLRHEALETVQRYYKPKRSQVKGAFEKATGPWKTVFWRPR